MIKIVADSMTEKDIIADLILKSDKKIDAFVYDDKGCSFDGINSRVCFMPDEKSTPEEFCVMVDEFIRSVAVRASIILIYTCAVISDDLERMADKLEKDKIMKTVILIGNRE